MMPPGDGPAPVSGPAAEAHGPRDPPTLRVHFQTHGCTTNLGDTRTMQGILESHGHRIVPTTDEADVLVLNTCTVVQTTDQKMEHTLREWSRRGKRIVAAGCMAAAQADAVRHAAPDAILLPPRHLHHIAAAVAGEDHGATDAPKAGLPRAVGTDAIIPLAEGCLFSCSYCLTKKARGDQSSYPLDLLVTDIREAVARGAVEIKLTSQDTSGYGFDIGTDLAALLTRVTRIGGDFRVRAGMMHPRTAHRILDPLLDAMDHPKVYRFLHLPIQTGSPRILKAMRRGHKMEEFWQVVEAFRDRFPDGAVSTDIIIGFPGETREDHEATLDLLRRLQAEHVNITRFSPRPGTDAPHLPDRVSTQTAKERSREATRLVMDLMFAKKRRRVGKTLDLLVVEPGKKEGSMLARTDAHEPVALIAEADEIPLASRVNARIVHAEPTYLVAQPLGPPRSAAKGPATTNDLPRLRVL